jgi:putative membrane protein
VPVRLRRIAALVALAPLAVFAHGGGPLHPDDLWSAWKLEPGAVIPLVISAWLYARGARPRRGVTLRQTACFWAGLAILAIALVSPLHPLGEVLFSAHMAQHEVLMLLAAPLLVVSRPLVPFLWGLPPGWRRGIGQWSKTSIVQKAWRAITRPFSAWWVHAVALWVWHAPALFQATLRSEWVHTAQHLSFFLSALLFWWSLFYSRGRLGHGPAVFYVFTTAIHTGILGALLTFAPVVLYPAYAVTAPWWGLTGLQDQQIGGLIMWVPAGVVYLVVALILLAAWLRESDAVAESRSLAGPAAVLAIVGAMVLLGGCRESTAGAAALVTGGDPRHGAADISRFGCGSCHTVAGIPSAHGLVGPPLTGVRDRRYIAGMLPNEPANLIHWIRDPKSVNPKTAMPSLGLSERDAADIAAYLYSK